MEVTIRTASSQPARRISIIQCMGRGETNSTLIFMSCIVQTKIIFSCVDNKPFERKISITPRKRGDTYSPSQDKHSNLHYNNKLSIITKNVHPFAKENNQTSFIYTSLNSAPNQFTASVTNHG